MRGQFTAVNWGLFVRKIQPFSKLKKQIESLFVPQLEMEVNCISYPVRTQFGSSSIPRFYIKLGKDIIWDFPKDFPLNDVHYHLWKGEVRISDLIRDYIDTPLNELTQKEFILDRFTTINDVFFQLEMIELLLVADRRIGKQKLLSLNLKTEPSKQILKRRIEWQK